jgi:hypothetical protein
MNWEVAEWCLGDGDRKNVRVARGVGPLKAFWHGVVDGLRRGLCGHMRNQEVQQCFEVLWMEVRQPIL